MAKLTGSNENSWQIAAPVGSSLVEIPQRGTEDGFVSIDGAEMYRISRFDEIPPFLMSVTSDSDLWMYLSSTGGLTAGRTDEDGSLFPYECEDRLHRLRGVTGPITLLRVASGGNAPMLWEPFDTGRMEAGIERNLYKSALGNRVLFEEVHAALGMTFRYSWSACDEFGFVRTARLTNHSWASFQVHLLDGLLNILPAGVKLGMSQSSSCLVDAYKRCEIDGGLNLAIYSLTGVVTDRPEPAECLRASAVWSRGMEKSAILLEEEAVRDFRSDRELRLQRELTGRRGAFLLESEVTLGAGKSIEWDIVADVNMDHMKLARLREFLEVAKEPRRTVQQELGTSEEGVRKIVATCDGLQISTDQVTTAHHASNVLFNCMRGGLPIDQCRVLMADFIQFVKERNGPVYRANEGNLAGWDLQLPLAELIERAEHSGDVDLYRLALEYLPLTFGRRHGDPSRPWNRFSIRLKNPDGSRRIGYQGNWRDIFQNWEALALSFPNLLESFIAKFVNASTVDGFNPYRLSQDGIDWEEHNPNDPWSNIGYWGDHQIVYLLKLMEASANHHPGMLQRFMLEPIFSYANVPYRLRPYVQMTHDPRGTIEFDRKLAGEIGRRARTLGADGKLVLDADGKVYHVCLLEKLLVSLLSKLSNLVVGGGIWMNTQRPEWNDANNALAGNGVSVVTLCYLGRYVSFVRKALGSISFKTAKISVEVLEWAEHLCAVLEKHAHEIANPGLADQGRAPAARRHLLEKFGAVFDSYRQKVYSAGFSSKAAVAITSIIPILDAAQRAIDETINQNRRSDGLYTAYNLLDLSDDHSAHITPLPENLEGQVAVLSSGALSGGEAVSLLESLFCSELWREDQQSFMLYPRRTLPGFVEVNRVPEELVRPNPLLMEMMRAGDESVIARDARGGLRFNGDFHNARDLDAVLGRLAEQRRWKPLVAAHRQAVLEAFESVFHHKAFTGRSGKMYAYEGLGCIYWHMVAKLLLATQEVFWKAVDECEPAAGRLASIYYRIRGGLGFNKRAREYGAVPIDPYSHTPASGGARQPGMTGQVKEEILTRLGEWGVRVREGKVHFQPRLLRASEFLRAPSVFECFGADGRRQEIELPKSSAAFTLCQTPVIYAQVTSGGVVEIEYVEGTAKRSESLELTWDDSVRIFARSGEIKQIRVSIPRAMLLDD
jgi:hypothetical protein